VKTCKPITIGFENKLQFSIMWKTTIQLSPKWSRMLHKSFAIVGNFF